MQGASPPAAAARHAQRRVVPEAASQRGSVPPPPLAVPVSPLASQATRPAREEACHRTLCCASRGHGARVVELQEPLTLPVATRPPVRFVVSHIVVSGGLTNLVLVGEDASGRVVRAPLPPPLPLPPLLPPPLRLPPHVAVVPPPAASGDEPASWYEEDDADDDAAATEVADALEAADATHAAESRRCWQLESHVQQLQQQQQQQTRTPFPPPTSQALRGPPTRRLEELMRQAPDESLERGTHSSPEQRATGRRAGQLQRPVQQEPGVCSAAQAAALAADASAAAAQAAATHLRSKGARKAHVKDSSARNATATAGSGSSSSSSSSSPAGMDWDTAPGAADGSGGGGKSSSGAASAALARPDAPSAARLLAAFSPSTFVHRHGAIRAARPLRSGVADEDGSRPQEQPPLSMQEGARPPLQPWARRAPLPPLLRLLQPGPHAPGRSAGQAASPGGPGSHAESHLAAGGPAAAGGAAGAAASAAAAAAADGRSSGGPGRARLLPSFFPAVVVSRAGAARVSQHAAAAAAAWAKDSSRAAPPLGAGARGLGLRRWEGAPERAAVQLAAPSAPGVIAGAQMAQTNAGAQPSYLLQILHAANPGEVARRLAAAAALAVAPLRERRTIEYADQVAMLPEQSLPLPQQQQQQQQQKQADTEREAQQQAASALRSSVQQQVQPSAAKHAATQAAPATLAARVSTSAPSAAAAAAAPTVPEVLLAAARTLPDVSFILDQHLQHMRPGALALALRTVVALVPRDVPSSSQQVPGARVPLSRSLATAAAAVVAAGAVAGRASKAAAPGPPLRLDAVWYATPAAGVHERLGTPEFMEMQARKEARYSSSGSGSGRGNGGGADVKNALERDAARVATGRRLVGRLVRRVAAAAAAAGRFGMHPAPASEAAEGAEHEGASSAGWRLELAEASLAAVWAYGQLADQDDLLDLHGMDDLAGVRDAQAASVAAPAAAAAPAAPAAPVAPAAASGGSGEVGELVAGKAQPFEESMGLLWRVLLQALLPAEQAAPNAAAPVAPSPAPRQWSVWALWSAARGAPAALPAALAAVAGGGAGGSLRGPQLGGGALPAGTAGASAVEEVVAVGRSVSIEGLQHLSPAQLTSVLWGCGRCASWRAGALEAAAAPDADDGEASDLLWAAPAPGTTAAGGDGAAASAPRTRPAGGELEESVAAEALRLLAASLRADSKATSGRPAAAAAAVTAATSTEAGFPRTHEESVQRLHSQLLSRRDLVCALRGAAATLPDGGVVEDEVLTLAEALAAHPDVRLQDITAVLHLAAAWLPPAPAQQPQPQRPQLTARRQDQHHQQAVAHQASTGVASDARTPAAGDTSLSASSKSAARRAAVLLQLEAAVLRRLGGADHTTALTLLQLKATQGSGRSDGGAPVRGWYRRHLRLPRYRHPDSASQRRGTSGGRVMRLYQHPLPLRLRVQYSLSAEEGGGVATASSLSAGPASAAGGSDGAGDAAAGEVGVRPAASDGDGAAAGGPDEHHAGQRRLHSLRLQHQHQQQLYDNPAIRQYGTADLLAALAALAAATEPGFGRPPSPAAVRAVLNALALRWLRSGATEEHVSALLATLLSLRGWRPRRCLAVFASAWRPFVRLAPESISDAALAGIAQVMGNLASHDSAHGLGVQRSLAWSSLRRFWRGVLSLAVRRLRLHGGAAADAGHGRGGPRVPSPQGLQSRPRHPHPQQPQQQAQPVTAASLVRLVWASAKQGTREPRFMAAACSALLPVLTQLRPGAVGSFAWGLGQPRYAHGPMCLALVTLLRRWVSDDEQDGTCQWTPACYVAWALVRMRCLPHDTAARMLEALSLRMELHMRPQRVPGQQQQQQQRQRLQPYSRSGGASPPVRARVLSLLLWELHEAEVLAWERSGSSGGAEREAAAEGAVGALRLMMRRQGATLAAPAATAAGNARGLDARGAAAGLAAAPAVTPTAPAAPVIPATPTAEQLKWAQQLAAFRVAAVPYFARHVHSLPPKAMLCVLRVLAATGARPHACPGARDFLSAFGHVLTCRPRWLLRRTEHVQQVLASYRRLGWWPAGQVEELLARGEQLVSDSTPHGEGGSRAWRRRRAVRVGRG